MRYFSGLAMTSDSCSGDGQLFEATIPTNERFNTEAKKESRNTYGSIKESTDIPEENQNPSRSRINENWLQVNPSEFVC